MESRTPTTPIKRRLTAIIAADAVGFSRQMSENEEGTLQVLRFRRHCKPAGKYEVPQLPDKKPFL